MINKLQKFTRLLICSGVGFMVATRADAASFSLLNDEVTGSFDSELSYGIAWRIGNPDSALDTPANGGNYNFDSGDIVTNRITGVHELGLTAGNYGAFVRASYFYDGANDREDLSVPGLSNGEVADIDAVSDFNLLDAYLHGTHGPLTLRLGKQVISWGENTFIQGSLNDINTIDTSKLRVPGSDLKTALLPNEAIHAAFQLNDAMSLEMFYLFDFDQVTLDPAGTFWNTATFVADGGYQLGPLRRKGDLYAKNSGQWGAALHYFAPTLFNGFDFGVYYMNLHSHSPYMSSSRGVPIDHPVLPRASYMLEYPENIKYVGASFNTTVAGWAWGGEISHRSNAPVQLDGYVAAALGAPVPLTGGVPLSAASGTYIRGWDRLEVNQFQTTVQRIFIPHSVHADQGTVLAEFAVNWVNDKPTLPTFEPITDSSGGYQLRYSLDYNRAIANTINLSPAVGFRHDVWGVSSETGGAKLFIKNRKSINLGINWSYLVNLYGSISYTKNFDGDGKDNAAGGQLYGDEDRQWVSVSVSYQF